MEKPKCACFNGQHGDLGEMTSHDISSKVCDFFLNRIHQKSICQEAIYHVALETIVVLLDTATFAIREDRGHGLPDEELEKISKAGFEEQLKTLLADLRARRIDMDAHLDEVETLIRPDGVRLQ